MYQLHRPQTHFNDDDVLSGQQETTLRRLLENHGATLAEDDPYLRHVSVDLSNHPFLDWEKSVRWNCTRLEREVVRIQPANGDWSKHPYHRNRYQRALPWPFNIPPEERQKPKNLCEPGTSTPKLGYYVCLVCTEYHRKCRPGINGRCTVCMGTKAIAAFKKAEEAGKNPVQSIREQFVATTENSEARACLWQMPFFCIDTYNVAKLFFGMEFNNKNRGVNKDKPLQAIDRDDSKRYAGFIEDHLLPCAQQQRLVEDKKAAPKPGSDSKRKSRPDHANEAGKNRRNANRRGIRSRRDKRRSDGEVQSLRNVAPTPRSQPETRKRHRADNDDYNDYELVRRSKVPRTLKYQHSQDRQQGDLLNEPALQPRSVPTAQLDWYEDVPGPLTHAVNRAPHTGVDGAYNGGSLLNNGMPSVVLVQDLLRELHQRVDHHWRIGDYVDAAHVQAICNVAGEDPDVISNLFCESTVEVRREEARLLAKFIEQQHGDGYQLLIDERMRLTRKMAELASQGLVDEEVRENLVKVQAALNLGCVNANYAVANYCFPSWDLARECARLKQAATIAGIDESFTIDEKVRELTQASLNSNASLERAYRLVFQSIGCDWERYLSELLNIPDYVVMQIQFLGVSYAESH